VDKDTQIRVHYPKAIINENSKLFQGKKLIIWIAIPVIYGFAMAFLTKPVAFSSTYFGWFFNPHLLYIEDINETVC